MTTNGTMVAEYEHLRRQIRELEQERDTLQQIVNRAAVFIYVFDLVEQRTIFGNQGLADQLGYQDSTELEQMGDDVLPQLMHPADLARFPEHAARFAPLPDNEIIEFEYRMRHHDGDWRWFVSRDRVFRRTTDGSPQQIIGVVQDVTKQKQAQEAMQFAQLALDHASDAIFWVDANGRFVYANHAAYISLEYSPEELRSLRIMDIDQTVTAERWQSMWAMLQQQGAATFESRHWRKDGSSFPVEVSASYLTFGDQGYLYGFVRDISARKQAERELRLAQFTLNNAVDSVQWLTSDGSLVYVNDTACTNLGYTRDEMLRMRIFDIDPHFAEAHMGPVWQELKRSGVQRLCFLARHQRAQARRSGARRTSAAGH